MKLKTDEISLEDFNILKMFIKELAENTGGRLYCTSMRRFHCRWSCFEKKSKHGFPQEDYIFLDLNVNIDAWKSEFMPRFRMHSDCSLAVLPLLFARLRGECLKLLEGDYKHVRGNGIKKNLLKMFADAPVAADGDLFTRKNEK